MPKVWYNINFPWRAVRPSEFYVERFNYGLDRQYRLVYTETAERLGETAEDCPKCGQISVFFASRGIRRLAFWRRGRFATHTTWRDGAEHKYPAEAKNLKWCKG